ncbi:hypothetical protein M3P21_12545 [Ruegeria sp. 2012CJ41-6]|uniref:DUF1003 domain-containing protein n=1 Tax=Ruegeria spongiae TaxID=2942209 RepID=A0ABT0Q3B0_9RHOB|nr:hypothetical protein [Ruegeria spongiae]MCL6284354.1 hypothetical protein [Ruegeria spongiae]
MTTSAISELLFSEDASSLTDEQIGYFRDHPEMLDLIGDRETLGLRNLWRILWIAVFLVSVSKILSVSYGDEFDLFFFNVVSDLVFEMGAALIGSVATVIFIQYRQKQQFQDNMAFRAEVQRRVKALPSR